MPTITPTQRVRHPRILDNKTYRQAFDAWESACNDVVNKWNHLADKVNLEPRLPPALTRAADIVRSHAPPTLTQDQIDRAVDTLHAPYSQRTIRTFRAAIKITQEPAEQAERIFEVICGLGLEPSVPPKPLPKITPDNVHLVCRVVLVPKGSTP